MNIESKLELLRKIACLGERTIMLALSSDDESINLHIMKKYERYRRDHGVYGNFLFLLELDLEHAERLLNYLEKGERNESNC